MGLRAEYSLGHSPFNAFLHASVGEEVNGAPLTVLSAFTRLGLDPWGEADRLSRMPKAAAAQSMQNVIARFPMGTWSDAESSTIASRLVDCLPASGTVGVYVGQGGSTERAPAFLDSARWLLPAALAAISAMLLFQLFGGS